MQDFFSKEDEQIIINSIKEAEKNTSGEIKVHIEEGSGIDALQRAKEVFHILKMDNTKERNGVIFYLDIKNKLFAIYGDKRINDKVPENFWHEIKNVIIHNFKKNLFQKGLSEGIIMTGEALKDYFPYQKDDINEISDEISKGNI